MTIVRLVKLLIIFVLWGCAHNPTEAPVEDPPNLILIIADDMAWSDCGAYGHPRIKTPNIDRLAKEGMLFHNAFLTTSSCSPSRASIITGTYPHQTDAEQLHWPLPAEKTTFVEKLRSAGYWTGQAGKWHFGDYIKDRFDFIAPVGTSGFVFNDENANDKSKTNADGSGCENWIATLNQRPKNKPFFLWLAAVDPHRPYTEDTPKLHDAEDVIIPQYLPDTKTVREDFAVYYDEISRLDGYLGKLVAELDRQKISENTFVLFISDNGRPFPREKTTLYDGGIKTPWIAKWPKKIESGSSTQALVSSVDIAPTFLSLAGVPIDTQLVGLDFRQVLTAPTTRHRTSIYAEDHWHDYEDLSRAIRTSQYKYIRNYYEDLPNTPPADAFRGETFQEILRLENMQKLTPAQRHAFIVPRPAEEFYDLINDPQELNNLITDETYEKHIKELREELANIQARTNDVMPSARTLDEFDRATGMPLPNRKRPRPSKEQMGIN